MLAGKRAVRVGDQILREIADVLMKKVKDPRVEGVTITGIRMSNDLKHAKVFYSVFGGKNNIARVQEGLDSARGFIKREIGLRLVLKYMPDIIFRHDPTLERGRHLEEILGGLKESGSANIDE